MSIAVPVRIGTSVQTYFLPEDHATVRDLREKIYESTSARPSLQITLNGKDLNDDDKLDQMEFSEENPIDVQAVRKAQPSRPQLSIPRREDVDYDRIPKPDDYAARLQELRDLSAKSIPDDVLEEALLRACYDSNRAANYVLALTGQMQPRPKQKVFTPEEDAFIRDTAEKYQLNKLEVAQAFGACGKDREATLAIVKTWVANP